MPELAGDTRYAEGTGKVTWRATYQGGQIKLGGVRPRGGEDYKGDIDVFIVTTTYLSIFENVLKIRSNVTTQGHSDGYSDRWVFSTNNCAFVRDTAEGLLPCAELPVTNSSCDQETLVRGGLRERDGGGVRHRAALPGGDGKLDLGSDQVALRGVDG